VGAVFVHEVFLNTVFVDFCPSGSFVGCPGRAVPVPHAKIEGTILPFTAVYFVESYDLLLRCPRRERPFPPYLDDALGRLNDRVFVAEILNIILICHVPGSLSPILTRARRNVRKGLAFRLRLRFPGFLGNLRLLLGIGPAARVHRRDVGTGYEKQAGKNNYQFCTGFIMP
jgi:hypothetical protein